MGLDHGITWICCVAAVLVGGACREIMRFFVGVEIDKGQKETVMPP